MCVLTAKNNLVVQSAWQQYTAGASLDVRHLSPEIASSWQRCQNLNVDPLRTAESEIDRSELKERLRQAIREENFELAAELRDRLKVLE